MKVATVLCPAYVMQHSTTRPPILVTELQTLAQLRCLWASCALTFAATPPLGVRDYILTLSERQLDAVIAPRYSCTYVLPKGSETPAVMPLCARYAAKEEPKPWRCVASGFREFVASQLPAAATASTIIVPRRDDLFNRCKELLQ